MYSFLKANVNNVNFKIILNFRKAARIAQTKF